MEVSLRILLVEDNHADIHILTEFFRESPFPMKLDVVNDGEQATHYLKNEGSYSGMQIPDVVLLDINLPKKNGFEVLAEMRSDARLCNVPVYVISTTRNPDDIRKGADFKVAAFLKKPTQLSEVESLVFDLTTKEFPKYLPVKT